MAGPHVTPEPLMHEPLGWGKSKHREWRTIAFVIPPSLALHVVPQKSFGGVIRIEALESQLLDDRVAMTTRSCRLST